MRKENFMAPLNLQLMDHSHIKEVKDVSDCCTASGYGWGSVILSYSHPLQYLTAVSDPRGGEECMEDTIYREG